MRDEDTVPLALLEGLVGEHEHVFVVADDVLIVSDLSSEELFHLELLLNIWRQKVLYLVFVGHDFFPLSPSDVNEHVGVRVVGHQFVSQHRNRPWFAFKSISNVLEIAEFSADALAERKVLGDRKHIGVVEFVPLLVQVGSDEGVVVASI